MIHALGLLIVIVCTLLCVPPLIGLYILGWQTYINFVRGK